MTSNLDKLKNKLRNLPQYKNLTEEEISKIAHDKLEQEEILCSLTFCVNEKEREFAKKLLENYLSENSIETTSDKGTLRQLIDFEILSERIKEMLKKEYDKANPIIPLEMVDQLKEINKQIEDFKENLGFSRKDKENNSAVQIIEDLKDRFHKFINQPENRSNYEFECPNCKTIFLLRKRIDKITDEVVEHPWYIEGGVLYNKEIFKDLAEGKITIEQAKRYLACYDDYIPWIIKNYPLDQDKEENV